MTNFPNRMSYIYHYTSLPVLISIINTRQLKLTRLDKFNELYEPNGFFPKEIPNDSDIIRLFRDIYVSSWTTDETESMSYWNLFSNLETGIRIGIDASIVFSQSDSCEVQITPLSFCFSSNFRQKTPNSKLELVKIKGCKSCIEEITDVINTEEQFSSFEELRANIQRKKLLPYISSNNLSYPNEVRLIAQVSSKTPPHNKKALKEYDYGTNMDYTIEFVLATLPSNFFENLEIIVSPEFSETNLNLLNAFLLKHSFHPAIRSNITSIYRNFKESNTLLNLR